MKSYPSIMRDLIGAKDKEAEFEKLREDDKRMVRAVLTVMDAPYKSGNKYFVPDACAVISTVKWEHGRLVRDAPSLSCPDIEYESVFLAAAHLVLYIMVVEETNALMAEFGQEAQ